MDSTVYDPHEASTMMDPTAAESPQFLSPFSDALPMPVPLMAPVPYMAASSPFADYGQQPPYPMMDQTEDILSPAVPTLPFNVDTSSSLASALDPAAAVPVTRTRANTLSALPLLPIIPEDDSLKQEEAPKERVVGNMLRNIAQVIKTAGDACHQNQAARVITPGDETKTRHVIQQINDLIQGMGLPTTTQPEPSRKRQAGELNAEQPPVKILKPEPEEVNLSALPLQSAPASSLTFARSLIPSQSLPPSRAHTPPPVSVKAVSVPSNFRPPPFPHFNALPTFDSAHRFAHANRHHHSRSMGSIPRESNGFNAPSAPVGRMARNGYFVPEHGWSTKGLPPKSVPTLPTFTYPATIDGITPAMAPPVAELADAEDDDGDSDEVESPGSQHTYSETTPISDIPAEYRSEVDRLFKSYLNQICSNLDATDNKGDPIHQQLMAKKMQKLDELADFRPFKFRIQAFTAAFLDWLAEHGYPEDKIPMKKVRNYLWRQPLILRFNDDGKKAKSKGNHIWQVDARKTQDGGWEFRPFMRKIAGSAPPVAYPGIQWTWKPRISDPQACWHNIPVQYSSPSLPSWLQWQNDVLVGTPPPNAESCEIVTHAKFSLDGQEGVLTRTFFLMIASSATNSTEFNPRPLMASLRSASDSMLPAWSTPLPPMQATTGEEDEARVKQVLEQVAERLTQETQPAGVLAEQQKSLVERTVDACLDDCAEAAKEPEGSHQLAEAGQKVVVQAAEYIVRKSIVRKASLTTIMPHPIPLPPTTSTMIQNVDHNELVETTKDAIAEAVKERTQEAPANEVDELSVLLIACRMLDTALRPQPPVPQVTHWVEPAAPLAPMPDWYVQQYV